MLFRMIRKIKVSSDWFGCVLVISFHIAKVFSESVTQSSSCFKLATGKLLNGAAVLTTTRPTALSCIERVSFDKIFEILGFSSEQVKEYVTKFSAEEDKDAGETIWRHIGGNRNILSLCYIPASCFIICSTLFQMVKFYGSKSLSLPTNLTVIYKKAVKIFYFRHNKEFRGKNFPSNWNQTSYPLKWKRNSRNLKNSI